MRDERREMKDELSEGEQDGEEAESWAAWAFVALL